MSNEYIYPQTKSIGTISMSTGGLSLRDYFAASVMSGLCADELTEAYSAKLAYARADAMLVERAKIVPLTYSINQELLTAIEACWTGMRVSSRSPSRRPLWASKP